jgi:hypothetical protein
MMLKQFHVRSKMFAGWRLIGLCCLVGSLLLLAVASVQAQSDEPDDVKPCASCHSTEADAWSISPHANLIEENGMPGATCEACHGAYVRGHPDSAVVDLRVDSSMCQDCHAGVFSQWQESIHAQANVQCISCHSSHSQGLRLTDQEMCRACHKESLSDPFHTAHWYTDASCTNCHLAPTALPNTLVMAGDSGFLTTASHDFTTVSSENCLDCHRTDIGSSAERNNAHQLLLADLRSQSQRVAELDARLAAARRTSYSFQVMTPMALGFGIGIGGMLGIIFMVVFSRLGRKDDES